MDTTTQAAQATRAGTKAKDRSRCGKCGHAKPLHAGGARQDGACTFTYPDGKRCPCGGAR